ncbi:hypothetical protein BMS3Abin07_00877 [bacterium BMS3Abin07]|nr:hypothetical protein BMS3Abin07_00877 [bacterium BMS3Abin07]
MKERMVNEILSIRDKLQAHKTRRSYVVNNVPNLSPHDVCNRASGTY